MATVPTPFDATTGVKFSASASDTGVRDPLIFLLDPPHCSVYDNTGVLAVNATFTLMQFDTETDDTDTMHNTVTNNSRITFNTAGRYEILIHTGIAVATTYTVYDLRLTLNAAGVAGGGTSIRTWNFGSAAGKSPGITTFVTVTRVFAANDYVELFLAQTSGANRNVIVAGQYGTGIQARWIGNT